MHILAAHRLLLSHSLHRHFFLRLGLLFLTLKWQGLSQWHQCRHALCSFQSLFAGSGSEKVRTAKPSRRLAIRKSPWAQALQEISLQSLSSVTCPCTGQRAWGQPGLYSRPGEMASGKHPNMACWHQDSLQDEKWGSPEAAGGSHPFCVPAAGASPAPYLMKCGCAVPLQSLSSLCYERLLRNTHCGMSAQISCFQSWLLRKTTQNLWKKKKNNHNPAQKNWIDDF